MSCVARLSGRSITVLVLMAITTKPLEASRGPYQATDDWLAMKPGAKTTPPNVPWLVSVGE
jgi:hypothetical protein